MKYTPSEGLSAYFEILMREFELLGEDSWIFVQAYGGLTKVWSGFWAVHKIINSQSLNLRQLRNENGVFKKRKRLRRKKQQLSKQTKQQADVVTWVQIS